jgi:hypothetical protein
MRRRICIKRVNTNDLIIRARSEILPIRGEANGMNSAGMIAHRGELFWLAGEFGVASIVNGLCGPDSNVSIYYAHIARHGLID